MKTTTIEYTNINQLSIVKRIIYELKVAFLISLNNWRVRLLAYPLSFISYSLSPLIYLLPTVFYAEAIIGGRESGNLEFLTGSGDVILFLTLGVASLFMSLRIYWITAFGIRREEWTGTLESIYMTPLSRVAMIAGASLYGLQFSIWSLTLQLAAMYVLYNLGLNIVHHIVPMLLSIFLSYLTINGFAMMLAGITIYQKQAWRLILFIDSTLSLVAPALYPLSIILAGGTFKPVIEFFVTISPLTWIIESFREAGMYGLTPYFIECLLNLTVMAMFWTAVGFLAFKKLDQITKQKGHLGKY